jgi:uncharacterized RDD family membrane protein YckC
VTGAGLESQEELVDRRVADFWIRGVARVIDYGLGFVAGAVALYVAIFALAFSGHPGEVTDWLAGVQEASAASIAAAILGGTLYSALSEFVGGASVGKLLCGLRVTSEQFGPPSLLGALVRSFALLIDGLFIGAVAYAAMERSPRKQRLGDRWGGTLVVRVRECPGARRGPIRTAGGILLGVAAFVAVCAYSYATQMASSSSRSI